MTADTSQENSAVSEAVKSFVESDLHLTRLRPRFSTYVMHMSDRVAAVPSEELALSAMNVGLTRYSRMARSLKFISGAILQVM